MNNNHGQSKGMSYYDKRGLTKLHRLGGGAIGTVYLCKDKEGRMRAVKEVKFNQVNGKAFYLREREMMKTVEAAGGHPNVMKYYHTGVHGQIGYLEYEYVEGIDVEDLMKIFVKTNAHFFFKIARTLLDSVAFLHRNGIYHRDISSGNVLICIDEKDSDMPFKSKLIDLGISCKMGGNDHNKCNTRIGAESVFHWPYDTADYATHKSLACNDIWLTGAVLFNIAFGLDFEIFAADGAGSGIFGMFYDRTMRRLGGYPIPPDIMDPSVRRVRVPLDPSVRDSLIEAQALVVQLYETYVLGEERDPVYDFNPMMDSSIHEVLRLALARREVDCFSAEELLAFINEVWNPVFPAKPQRQPLDTCKLPCEDPANNFYKTRCDRCPHCVWDDEGFVRGLETIHCRSAPPGRRSKADRTDCLHRPRGGEVKVWNPYRKECEIITEEPGALLSNRYSILFSDGVDMPLPGEEVRRRLTERDFSLLDKDSVILERLAKYPYHPLKTLISHSFFYDYFRDRTIPDNPFMGVDMEDLASLMDLRVSQELASNPKTRVDRTHKGKRYTYKSYHLS